MQSLLFSFRLLQTNHLIFFVDNTYSMFYLPGVNPTERDAILQLEEELLNGELDIPVYFAEVSLDR